MRKRDQNKGIFCLEGLWDTDLRVGSTVQPMLELMRLHESVDYIHREHATKEEFEFYLSKWTQKTYDAYPILYLTSHGHAGGIELGGEFYSLEDMTDLLSDKCENRLIMLSSCTTLQIPKERLTHLLEKTGALMVCGYRVDVDWMRSLAFELLLFSSIQEREFSLRGVGAISSEAVKLGATFEDLAVQVVTAKGTNGGTK